MLMIGILGKKLADTMGFRIQQVEEARGCKEKKVVAGKKKMEEMQQHLSFNPRQKDHYPSVKRCKVNTRLKIDKTHPMSQLAR